MAAWSKLKGMVTTSSGSMADAVFSQRQSTLQHRVHCAYKIHGVGRRHASCAGAQHLSRHVCVAVLRDNVQHGDIVIAMVSLVTEVVPNLAWTLRFPQASRHASRQYSHMDGPISRATSQ